MKKPVTVMRNELISMVQCLEPDAVEVLHQQAGRMIIGRKAYGDLNIASDVRDWTEQTVEELLDGMNYLTIELVKLRRSREPR